MALITARRTATIENQDLNKIDGIVGGNNPLSIAAPTTTTHHHQNVTHDASSEVKVRPVPFPSPPAAFSVYLP